MTDAPGAPPASADASPDAFWCELAWLPDGIERAVRVTVVDGVTTGMEVGAAAQPGDVELAGLVLPGFADAHSHAFHRALRGRTHAAGPDSFWSWRERMYAVAAALTPEAYLRLARALYAELALNGVSVVGEFHYLHHDADGVPYADPNAMGRALRQAAREAGVRLTLLDACYLSSGSDAPLSSAQLRFSDGSALGWRERVEAWRDAADGTDDDDADDGFLLGAAIHSVRAVPPAQLGPVVDWARTHDRPLHVHLSEQVAENTAALERYGRTPTAILDDAGALGPATTAVHAVHLTEDDVARLGGAHVSICACPTTERDLGDGIAPNAALLAAGARLCVGTDQHVGVDLLAEVRGVEEHERLAAQRRGLLSPRRLLAALTADGHTSLGRPGDGRIAVGARTDLVAIDLASPRTAGTRPEQAIMVAEGRDVRDVVVGGRVVVAGGRHRLGDVGLLLAEAIAEVDRLVDVPGDGSEERTQEARDG